MSGESMEGMATIRADFAVTAADWGAAHRIHVRSAGSGLKRMTIHLVALALVTVFLCAIFHSVGKREVRRSKPATTSSGVPISSFALCLTVLVLGRSQSRWAFKASGLDERPLSYAFKDDVVEWSDPAGGGIIQMRYFSRWFEDPTLFVLTQPIGSPLVLPKRALAEGQDAELRALLLARIGPEGESRELPRDCSLPPSESDELFTVETSLTGQDMEEVVQIYAKSPASLWQWSALLVVSLLAGLFLAEILSDRSFLEVLGSPLHLGVAAVLLVIFTVSASRQAKQTFTTAGLEDTKIRYTIGDGIFGFDSPYFQHKRRLSSLLRWMEGPNVFILFESAIGVYLIPKRALAEGQAEFLRTTLTEQIGPVGKTRRTTV